MKANLIYNKSNNITFVRIFNFKLTGIFSQFFARIIPPFLYSFELVKYIDLQL